MFKDGPAVACKVLIKRDSVADAAEKISKRRLTTFERLPTEILAVQFDQVEGAEHGSVVELPIPQQVED